MANRFITPSVVAREAITLLASNTVAANLVHRGHAQEFTASKVGDTVSVRRPATFAMDEFDGNSINVQDASESSVPLTLEKHFDISFKVSARDLTLSVNDFAQQLLAPALLEFSEGIDRYLLSKVANVGRVAPDAMDPKAVPTGIGDVAKLREVMTSNRIPRPWNAVVSPTYETNLLSINSFVEADKRGNTDAMREASLGRVMGIDWYMGQNVDTSVFTPGVESTGTVAVNGAFAKGDTSIDFDGGDVSTSVVAGDRVRFADGTMYAVATGATGATGTITLVEPLRADLADDSSIEIVGGSGAGGDAYSVQGALFHPNAFTLATVPLSLPMGGGVEADFVNYNGFGIRVTIGYDNDKKSDVVSLDMLCGARLIDGNLAAALIQDEA